MLYLGGINDQQQAAWRGTLAVFDAREQRCTAMSVFPDGREVPAGALDSVQVRLRGLELPRRSLPVEGPLLHALANLPPVAPSPDRLPRQVAQFRHLPLRSRIEGGIVSAVPIEASDYHPVHYHRAEQKTG